MQLVHMTGPRARPSAAGLRRDAMAMRRRRAGRQLRKESAVTQGDGPPFGTTSCLYSGPWHIPVPLGPSPCATTAFAATLGALLRLPMPQQGPGAWIQQLPIGCLSAMRCRFSSDYDPSDRQSHADIAPVASCCSPPKAQTPNRPKASAPDALAVSLSRCLAASLFRCPASIVAPARFPVAPPQPHPTSADRSCGAAGPLRPAGPGPRATQAPAAR